MPTVKKPVLKKYIIHLDKSGQRYVKIGKNKIFIKESITDAAFLKWLVKYLHGKRKTRRRRKTKQPEAAETFTQRDLSELPAHLAGDEGLRNLANAQRISLGKPLLTAPPYPGGPPLFAPTETPIRGTPIAAIEGPKLNLKMIINVS